MLCTDNNHFANHQDMVLATTFVGGDHRKGAFAMLLTMCIEMTDRRKRHVDEVIGEIDCNNDNVESL